MQIAGNLSADKELGTSAKNSDSAQRALSVMLTGGFSRMKGSYSALEIVTGRAPALDLLTAKGTAKHSRHNRPVFLAVAVWAVAREELNASGTAVENFLLHGLLHAEASIVFEDRLPIPQLF